MTNYTSNESTMDKCSQVTQSRVSTYSSQLRLSYCCSINKSYLILCDPWTAACQPSLSFTVSQSLLKLMSTESVMPSNHLILYCPLLLCCVTN